MQKRRRNCRLTILANASCNTGMSTINAPPLNSPLAIYLSAEAFIEATVKLEDQLRNLPSVTQIYATDAAHTAPTITLDSFSLELYMKCLYAIDHGKPMKGHNCKAIFSALKPGTRDSLRYHYNIQLATDPTVGLVNKMQPGFSPTLDNCLDLCSNLFEKYRYLYEGIGQAKMFYWPLLRLAVRETVLAINPAWRAQ